MTSYQPKPSRSVLLLLGLLLLTGCAKAPATQPPAPTPAPAQQPAAPKPSAGDYSKQYPALWKISDDGPAVPGLDTGVTPQGLAYWQEKGWLIISGYTEGSPSTLTVVDAKTGAPVKTVQMYLENGSAYEGHAGGVAVSQKNLWVSSGNNVWWLPLTALAEAADKGKVTFGGHFVTVARASFTTYAEGILWVGEFYDAPNYETDDSHKISRNGLTYNAWAAGYKLDKQTDLIPSTASVVIPDYVLAIPNQIQGMAVTPNNIIFSQSFNRNKDGNLFKYKRPDLAGEPHQTVKIGNQTVPLWFMERKFLAEALPQLTVPPMSEGIITDGGNRLFVLFESGSKLYRPTASNPMDHLRAIRLDDWDRQTGTK
jgi:hypothetical protein